MPRGNNGTDSRLETLTDSLKEHAKQDEKSLDEIRETMRVMKDNHLSHIQDATAKQGTDIEWIKKILWLFLVPIVGGFIGIVYQIMSS